ncbi:NUDIX hydrolase [Endozoicomonas sp. OPT23]|uniref:NUDIX hydrolase n=1 Tax=Endozoicomonas sp. OPT23 TaxID=2072845 RepID=UPI00129B1F9B|nr:NUDIX hydrolase [Endozoicomonas sp. OPT23]MRI34834.1 NUDIX hydrolase [Endozoicomonas sp. OPT23]
MGLNTALISIDVVAFRMADGQLQLLTRKLDQLYMLPAGRIEPQVDDCLDDTARRQLATLTDQHTAYLEQVETIGSPDRDSRGWSMTVVYYALMSHEDNPWQSDDAEWVTISEGEPEVLLAYDHKRLVVQALERLKNKIQYSSLPVYLLPAEFTLSDIQKVFETLLERAPPMRSIRNRFLREDLLIDTGKLRRGSNRPAALYRVREQSPTCLFDRLYLTTQ